MPTGDPIAFGGALIMSTNGPTIGRCTITAHACNHTLHDAKVTIDRDAVFAVDKPKPKRIRRRP